MENVINKQQYIKVTESNFRAVTVSGQINFENKKIPNLTIPSYFFSQPHKDNE